MAPKQDIVTHAIDRTPEYEEFMTKLRAFHEERGTTLDPEPKVGSVHLDLYKVFNHIVDNGGYDKICEEKLAWRRMAGELGLNTSQHQISATAFSLKERFYKFLAAYEIRTIHGKEPPPRDILEDVTAKGGSLLTRTRENFKGKYSGGLGDSAASGDDGTPSREKPTAAGSGEDGTPISSARAARNLRQAPTPRQRYQPEPTSSRPSRQVSGQLHPPGSSQSGKHQLGGGSAVATPGTPSAVGPGLHHLHQPGSAQGTPTGLGHHLHHLQRPGHGPQGYLQQLGSHMHPDLPAAVAQYNPREVKTLAIRPIETPRTNPAEFARRRLESKLPKDFQHSMIPKLHPGAFDGSNIYIRCLNALRCGIADERMYALHHWVRISFERTEKFRFDAFPGLDEGLVEASLRVGSLFFDVEWEIKWDPYMMSKISDLDGENGTSDILDRIKQLRPKPVFENIQTEKFRDEMLQVVEAVLTIRNMITMTDNAVHIARFPPVKDLICIILNLPSLEAAGEVKNYALDIAELITPYISVKPEDPFYQTLIAQLNSEDRGTILTALRAIGRISMNLEQTNQLGDIPGSVLENVSTWILQNDDEFTDACLDFLYQYTAVEANVDTLLSSINTDALVSQLVRLLSHGARRYTKDVVVEPERRVPTATAQGLGPAATIATMPPDLREELIRMKDPERIHKWVKCFFDHDPESFVTQIAAWQAYNNSLSDAIKRAGQPTTSPAEFIRNCSSIYQNSQPQVLTRGSEQQKFIIGGIRARENPLSVRGTEYVKCRWLVTADRAGGGAKKPCARYFLTKQAMYDHIGVEHLHLEQLAVSPSSSSDAAATAAVAGEAGNSGGGSQGGGQAQQQQQKKKQKLNPIEFKNVEKAWSCEWEGCTRYPYWRPFKGYLQGFCSHFGVHFADRFEEDGSARPPRGSKDWIVPARTMTFAYEETATARDDRNPQAPAQAAGIPLSAVLVLRNVARNVCKTKAEEELRRRRNDDASTTMMMMMGGGADDGVDDDKGGEDGNHDDLEKLFGVDVSLRDRLFRPWMWRLWEIATENRALAPHVWSLITMINAPQ